MRDFGHIPIIAAAALGITVKYRPVSGSSDGAVRERPRKHAKAMDAFIDDLTARA